MLSIEKKCVPVNVCSSESTLQLENKGQNQGFFLQTKELNAVELKR